MMNDMDAEYDNYWDTKLFLDGEELNSWGALDEPVSFDSSSSDGPASSAPANNIIMERDRRRKFNEKLYALRSVVPNITKMDKASIIKDSIEYIQQLQREEQELLAEVREMDAKKRKRSRTSPSSRSRQVLEVVELSVCNIGEKTWVVSLSCKKKRDIMMKVCEIFESFVSIKIITASFTSISDCLLHTLFIEIDEVMNAQALKKSIEVAISEVNGGMSPNGSFSF